GHSEIASRLPDVGCKNLWSSRVGPAFQDYRFPDDAGPGHAPSARAPEISRLKSLHRSFNLGHAIIVTASVPRCRTAALDECGVSYHRGGLRVPVWISSEPCNRTRPRVLAAICHSPFSAHLWSHRPHFRSVTIQWIAGMQSFELRGHPRPRVPHASRV